MDSLAAVLFIIGVSLVFLTSAFMRTPSAPALGNGPFRWPWQVRSWYSPAGYVLHLSGWVLWIVSAGIQLVS
ncbi:MAG: hypothetical protein ABFS42_04955 [Candidatus Krumholzibacteriota bacterium]